MGNLFPLSAPKVIHDRNPWPWIGIAVAIISIGAAGSLAIPTGSCRPIPAKLLQARASMKGMEIAMNGFDHEYGTTFEKAPFGRMMNLRESEDTVVGNSHLTVLMAKSPDLNPRGIRFYDPPTAKKGVNGLWQASSGNWHMSNVWGDPYRVRYDADGDGKIPDPEGTGGDIVSPYIFYTAGPDRDFATWKDNLVSWKWQSSLQ